MRRLFTIAAFTLWLPVLLVACGGDRTPVATPGVAYPTAQELKQAGQELFDTFSASIETQDGAALHGLFVANIRERCTVEQIQESLASGDTFFPKAEVRTVFLDLEDPSRASLELAVIEQPGGNQQGFASGFAFTFPLPMIRDEGEWRLSFPSLPVAPERGCPFADDFGQEEQGETATTVPRQLDATPQPAFPRLAPPPGVRSTGGGSGGGSGQYNASVFLVTDMTLAALLEHYRQQLIQPDWTVEQETMDESLVALTWTLRDEADQPWFGVLLITPAEDGRWVRLWMGGGGGVQTFVFPDGRAAPVPAPIRPN